MTMKHCMDSMKKLLLLDELRKTANERIASSVEEPGAFA
jgi:hypothetical protein